MHKIKFLEAGLAVTINAVFSDYNTLTLTPFNAKIDGEVTIYHSAPFMDKETYDHFFFTVSEFDLKGWSFVETPFEVGSEYVCFTELPRSHSDFSEVMVDINLEYAGGIFFHESMLVIGACLSDVELVIIKVNEKVNLNFGSGSSFITNSEAEELLRNHKKFLSSGNN